MPKQIDWIAREDECFCYRVPKSDIVGERLKSLGDARRQYEAHKKPKGAGTGR